MESDDEVLCCNPVIESSSFIVIIGKSGSGKSWLIKNLVLEHRTHFAFSIAKLVYVYRHMDENVKAIKERFDKPMELLKGIPNDLESRISPYSLVIVDDQENCFDKKETASLMKNFASYTCHHLLSTLICVCQSNEIMYAKHRMHSCLAQSTGLVLFRSVNNSSIVKRFLNNFDIELEDDCPDLYSLFKKFVSAPYDYLWVNTSPKLAKPQVYSNILECDDRPVQLFT